MRFLGAFLIFLNTEYWTLNTVNADSWKNLQQGDQTAQAFLNQMKQKKQEAGAYPFYQGTSKNSNISKNNLLGQAQQTASKDPAAQMIYESNNVRPQIKIDPTKDPLITGSQQVIDNPLEVIGGKGTQVVKVQQDGKTETLTCEEPGEDSLEICTRELAVKVEKIKVKKTKSATVHLTGCKKSHKDWHVRSCPTLLSQVLKWKPTRRNLKISPQIIDVTKSFKECLQEVVSKTSTRCHRCNNPRTTLPTDLKEDVIKSVVIERNYLSQPLVSGSTNYSRHGRLKTYDMYANLKIVYEEDGYKISPDEWSDNCARLEERVDNGLCGYASRVCAAPKQTRIINGYPVTRDCWQERMTYACSYPTKDDCGLLRARGCAQINSACKQKAGNICVVYQQTYQCKNAGRTTSQIRGGNTPFCMDGNCRDQSWEPNDELMSSVAQLSILKEMQGKFKGGSFFKGEDNRCSKYMLSFKDCCGSGSGWGKDMKLGSCKAEEKLLNKRRRLGLCHRVGTYCDKKVLGQCVKKKTSYCCFGSKLLKAFQEQGRAQIKLGWGKAKKPLCRGFTIQEIQRIDFSKLDLREAFEDIMKNFKPGKMGDISRQVGERLETIKKGIISNPKNPQMKQRDGA